MQLNYFLAQYADNQYVYVCGRVCHCVCVLTLSAAACGVKVNKLSQCCQIVFCNNNLCRYLFIMHT